MLKIDYKNSIVNVSNSILKYFTGESYHESLKELDELLDKDYENVVLLLYDGLGDYNINSVLNEKDFLIKNKIKVIDSVFPTTTTAATTSVLSGLKPSEHGWLGWDLYIKDIDKTVTMFRNIVKPTKEVVADYNVARIYFAYTNIIELINTKSENNAYLVSPFDGIKYNENSIGDMNDKIINLCKEKGKKFIYGYNVAPDNLMHMHGVDSEIVKNKIKEINEKLEIMSNELENSLIIVIADHGHINCKCLMLEDYPELEKMISKPLSIEPRVVNFFIKEEYKNNGVFEKEFNKIFSNDFILMSKKEIIESRLFGEGNINSRFESSLGDYVAIAINDKFLSDEKEYLEMKGAHAGMCEEEIKVPLIVIEK